MFKDRLQEALDIRNMKATELAEKLGTSRSTISHYLNGRNEPTKEFLSKIAKAMYVREEWLLGYDCQMDNYYDQEETAEIAQEMFENKELRLLFDAAKDCDPDTLNKVRQMLEILKNKEVN